MTKSAADIAEDMRAVGADRAKSADLLAGLFAENVELRFRQRGGVEAGARRRLVRSSGRAPDR